jgi:hypothetical protein
MKRLIMFLTLTSSLTAFADNSHCKGLYKTHFERISLIKTLSIKGEISAEFQTARLADENEIMEISIPVMCKDLSITQKQELKLEALSEIGI